MKTYLVGGAVRDQLLGRPVRERDFVVVGATEQELLAQGFVRVGRDFPVFLHPQTKEEYALARTERRTAPGHQGFTVHADPGVTLEQDLARRDLTINALARDSDHRLLDPYGGRRDLRQRLLRHVSPSFAEDPVRILRVARFAARYAALGFRVAGETMSLMRQMVQRGEVDTLVPERVWQELFKALSEDRPARFFEVLRACDAAIRLFPELEQAADGLPALASAAGLTEDREVRFAALTCNLGRPEKADQGFDPASLLSLCARLKTPTRFRDLALLAARLQQRVDLALTLSAAALLKIIVQADALRRPQRFEQFLLACQAVSFSRRTSAPVGYPQAALLLAVLKTLRELDLSGVIGGRHPQLVQHRIRERRVEAIQQLLAAEVRNGVADNSAPG